MIRVEVIREFFGALLLRETYDPRRNPYIIFGFLWGLPVPLFAVLLEWHASSLTGRPVSLLELLGQPFLIVLALHPPLFALVFGAMGTIRLGKTTRIASLLRDKEAEMERLAQANEELQKLAKLKAEFLSNVTHELKTPLVTIRGYTEMFETERLGALNEKQQRALAVIKRNCHRLQQQIETLLASSRNVVSLYRLKKEQVPLAELVSEVKERHAAVAAQKNVTVSYQFPEATVVLWGDHLRLMEVLDNLLGNAIKFTDPGGSVRVQFGEPAGGRLAVEVADTGCGVEEEAQKYIFERFRQADGSIRRRFGGSGLGLAVVASNLKAHGCSIRVESKKGEGARFFLELPVYTGAEDSVEEGVA